MLTRSPIFPVMNSTSEQKKHAALRILKKLVDNGFQALYAGGYVRDKVLGLPDSGDIDIATNARPETVSRLFGQTISVGEQFGVIIVVMEGIPFEVATFRSDIGISDGRHPAEIVFTDARSDALRRDFTINGMFYDPISDKIIDYVSGLEDIQAGVIRAIGDPLQRFSEDYLRMLRAVRFAARFNFSIEKNTWEALKENAGKIVSISAERIFAELDKMLLQDRPEIAIELLDQSDLLKYVLPEISALKGVPQPPDFHPEGDVFIHTLKALKLMHKNPSSVTAWSVLLHDCGKPATFSLSDRIRFNNHDRVGAAISREVLKRLKASNHLVESVEACIENHMNFMNVTRMRLSTLKKLLSRPTIEDELELHRVDCLASHGNLDNYYFVKSRLESFEKEQIKPAPLISGRDLIEMGYKPGPVFGKILSEVYDLQLEEKISTREQALNHVKQSWNPDQSN